MPAHPQPTHRVVDVDGVQIACWEHGDPDATPVLLLHATGFGARIWDQTVAALLAAGTPWRPIAVDVRGHGASAQTGEWSSWTEPLADLLGVADAYDLEGAVGVGHSMGGHLLVQLAAARPATFSRLVLVDPTIPQLTPDDGADADGPGPKLAAQVIRRRNRWPDPQALHDRLVDQDPYTRWQPAVLRDHCEHALRPAPDGDGMVLACAPEVEASIYRTAWRTPVAQQIAQVRVPVTVIRAREPDDRYGGFADSPTWPALASAFADAEDVPLPHLSHFIPMEAPEVVAAHIDGAG